MPPLYCIINFLNMGKILKIFLIILLFQNTLKAQDYYYYKGNKVNLQKSSEKILVKYRENKTVYKQENVSNIKGVKSLDIEKQKHFNNFSILDIEEEQQNSLSVNSIINNIETFNDDVIVNYFYKTTKGDFMGYTDVFVVKLLPFTSFDKFEKLLREYKVKFIEEDIFIPNKFKLQTVSSSRNVLSVANIFFETGMFEYSEPEWTIITKKLCTNDDLWNKQWGLNNTGQHGGTTGADIQVCDAWDITRGDNDITIAVIDEGVDLTHPDLEANIVDGFDATGRGTAGAYENNDNHGTACAGIIAAVADNEIGISGIAPNCRIMPVRIGYGNGDGGWVTNSSWISEGINWAVENGADVLSNSWECPSGYNSVTEAINNAVNNGRFNGTEALGCIVLFSSGNDNSTVNYPAYLDNVISVGSMSMCNQRKRSSKRSGEVNTGVKTDPKGVSCDEEVWWGSNYGNELDVVAPGVLITTTDINGYYIEDFNGTSSACPHAAGVTALILSANPCLTSIEARRVLELSCDRINTSGYCYNISSSHPNGSWNEEVGYGKVNAFKAVRYALSSRGISNPSSSMTVNSYGLDTEGFVFLPGCHLVSSGTYYGKRHQVIKTYEYPNTPNPIVIGSTNGLSNSNPNTSNSYFEISELSSTQLTVKTWVYEIESTVSGQSLGWIPCHIDDVEFDISILSQTAINENIEAVGHAGSANYYAINNINAEYLIVENGANVNMVAGNRITLGDGTHIKEGSVFSAKIVIPEHLLCENTTLKKAIKTGESSYFLESQIDKLKNIDYEYKNESDIKPMVARINSVSPNPTNSAAKIKYTVPENQNISISVFDLYGNEIKKVKNKEFHEQGIYQTIFNGSNLSSGVYYIKLKTEHSSDIYKIAIIK
ncbi:MAG: S8 family serine peptidase [bacterium]|nr:S8 family serine peptidase [bacterium]